MRPKKKQKKRKNREKFEINGKKPLILNEKRGRFFKTKQFFNRSLSGTERVESRIFFDRIYGIKKQKQKIKNLPQRKAREKELTEKN